MTDFESAWRAWRDVREARLRGAHGWLAITAIHWLTDVPERYDDVPGAWSGVGTAATVTLDAGEALTVEGRQLGTGTHALGPVDEEGLRVRFGDAVTAYDVPQGDAVGELAFTHDGTEHRLLAWDDDEGGLWILFRDATSGVTTYPANRQVVVAPPAADGTATLDLNRASNMPCAYTDFATCPVPPAENTLPFAVEAGEQIPSFGDKALGKVLRA